MSDPDGSGTGHFGGVLAKFSTKDNEGTQLFNIPNFNRLRLKAKPTQFVSPGDFFEPMVAVVAQKDVSGWVDRDKKIKWSMSYGRKYHLDRKTAREFMVKGYVYGPQDLTDDVSDDERADILSNVTIISVGRPINHG